NRCTAVHVIAGLDVAHGGPSYSVPRLCEALAQAGAQTSLFSVAGANEVPRNSIAGGYAEQRFAWDWAGVPLIKALRRSGGLRRALRDNTASADIIHDHGLWLMPNVYAGSAALRAHVPFVVSPRGMLSAAALSFSHLKKRAFWYGLQRRSVERAACLHATSEAEFHDIRAFGLGNPVAVIPNGIDLPEPANQSRHIPGSPRTVLSLGRIHPKKGLERLLRAWAGIEARNIDWQLRIVGPAEGAHDKELLALASELGVRRVSIEGPVYGEQKRAAYRGAELFVLPTLDENFGITVTEALAEGMPVISTKGAPWSGLESEGCGWWIDHGEEPLAASLHRAMALAPESLRAMGAKGRAWVARDFSWARVAGDMLQVYAWLRGQATAPAFVRLD